MSKYLVQYSTQAHKKLLIVIWGKDKAEVRKMLKRHLGSMPHTINKITLEEEINED